MCWWGNHLFVIFAVLDVSLAVNLCINCSFLHLYVIMMHITAPVIMPTGQNAVPRHGDIMIFVIKIIYLNYWHFVTYMIPFNLLEHCCHFRLLIYGGILSSGWHSVCGGIMCGGHCVLDSSKHRSSAHRSTDPTTCLSKLNIGRRCRHVSYEQRWT